MLSEKGLGNEIGIFDFFPDSDARWRCTKPPSPKLLMLTI